MRVPSMEIFEEARILSELKELSEYAKEVKAKLEPFVPYFPDNKTRVISPEIKSLRGRHSKLEEPSYEQKEAENKRLLEEQVSNLQTLADMFGAIESGEDAFTLLVNKTDNNRIADFIPAYNMARAYLGSKLKEIAYESKYFDVSYEVSYANHLPNLRFATKSGMFDVISKSRMIHGGVLVPLTTRSRVKKADLRFYKTELPSVFYVEDIRRTLEEVDKNIPDESILDESKKPFFLPKKWSDNKRHNKLKSLKYAYQMVGREEDSLMTLQRDADVFLGKEEIIVLRKDIEEDLRNYVKEINKVLGASIEVEVLYESLDRY